MRKVIIGFSLFFTALLFLSRTATAQIPKATIKRPGITLGAHLLYASPKGDFQNTYSFGAGGEVFGGVSIGRTFIIATTGFSEFKAQSGLHSGTLSYMPLKIGIKQFIFRRLLFVNADVGKATVKNKVFNESRFTRGIGVGAKLLGLEAGLYYDGWKNVNASGFSNSLNFKIGWSFNL